MCILGKACTYLLQWWIWKRKRYGSALWLSGYRWKNSRFLEQNNIPVWPFIVKSLWCIKKRNVPRISFSYRRTLPCCPHSMDNAHQMLHLCLSSKGYSWIYDNSKICKNTRRPGRKNTQNPGKWSLLQKWQRKDSREKIQKRKKPRPLRRELQYWKCGRAVQQLDQRPRHIAQFFPQLCF